MFWFGLALKLSMSVARCQSEISSSEFAEWVAYNNMRPFMIDRAEYSIAILSSIMANAHSKNKKYSYEDFLLQGDEKRETNPMIIEKTLGAIYGGN